MLSLLDSIMRDGLCMLVRQSRERIRRVELDYRLNLTFNKYPSGEQVNQE